METNLEQDKRQVKDAEEYVLLDLDDVCVQADIPCNASFLLSGLDTLNPVLVVGDRLKLIGEYQESIGTCYLFSDRDGEKAMLHRETGPSERTLIKETCIMDSNSASSKQIQPITGLHKVLKFRLAVEDEAETAIDTSAANL